MDFNSAIVEIKPRLRVYALGLTRNPDAADDLVTQTIIKVLEYKHTFVPGTNFAAWAFRIQRNEHIDNWRKKRTLSLIDDYSIPVPGQQESAVTLSEVLRVIESMPKEQRITFLMFVLEGMSVEEIALARSIAIGTVKSRISRARDFIHGEGKRKPAAHVVNAIGEKRKNYAKKETKHLQAAAMEGQPKSLEAAKE